MGTGSTIAAWMTKPGAWFINAARRTVVAAFPWLARPDDAWALERLHGGEAELFMRLPAQERAHGVEVAKRLLGLEERASSELVRAALLHDVGKLGTPQFVLWRVLTHLLPETDQPPEPKLTGLAGARQARRHHAAYGAVLIRAAGGPDAVAELVLHHHEPGGSAELQLLKRADERT